MPNLDKNTPHLSLTSADEPVAPDWYKHVVEQTPDSIKELDLDGTIRYVNSHGLARVAAQNQKEVLHTSWIAQWPEHVHPDVQAALEAAKRGEVTRFEADCVSSTGKLYYWDVTTTPLLDDAGIVRSILAVNRDITDRRLAEMALATLKEALRDQLVMVGDDADELREHLHQVDSAGMIQLSQGLSRAKIREEELDVARAAQHMAESAAAQAQKGEAVGQLLAGVVHDLNNVLQAASGAIEMAQACSDIAPREQLLLSMAQTALAHGTTMSKRLLGFARQHHYAPESVDVCALAKTMCPLLQQAIGNQVKLDYLPYDGRCVALLDPNTIERALMNLVINARDASAETGLISIVISRVSLKEEEIDPQQRAGEYVTVSVIDRGEGIAPEVRERLFEAYFTTKPSGKGTGLGLAQVYGAVRQANGFINVASEVGKGSTFTMAFPAI